MILIQRISKRYLLYQRPLDRLLDRHGEEFWALRDINLSVPDGEFLALVGPNGSGKSTLLQIVSGIVQPTSGRVAVGGRIAALLELGAGFNPEFTGRENVLLNSEILGISREDMKSLLPAIAGFASIGDYFDRPVKEYSTGMYVRLAFATAIHVQPDVLVIDEALAVGDAVFANRCIRKFEELRRAGVTVLFVSHDLGLVKRLADRAVLLVRGQIDSEGRPADVVNRYVGLVHEWQSRDVAGPSALEDRASFRHGDGASRILSVTLHDASGAVIATAASGQDVSIRVVARFTRPVEEPIVGILIRNRLGIDVYGTNTRVEGRQLGSFSAGETLEVFFTFSCRLAQQDYTITAATQNWDGSSQDWLDDVASFSVTDLRAVAGLASFPTSIEVRRL